MRRYKLKQKDADRVKRPSIRKLITPVLFLVLSIVFAYVIWMTLSILTTNFSMYLAISVALASGSLTLASIVLTYYLGEESRLLASVRTYLRDCLSHLQSWRTDPHRSAPSLQSIYDKTRHAWSSRSDSMAPPGALTFITPFVPFAVLVVTILSLVLFASVNDMLWMFLALFSLYLAIALLFWEFFALVYRLRNIQSIKTFSGSGRLWLNQINRQKYDEPLKQITYKAAKSKRLKVKLSFEGEIRNGFFHAVLIGDKLIKAYSDENTYFQKNVYTDTLKVIVDPKFDIGIIQGSCKFENTDTEMDLDLRLVGVVSETGKIKRELVRRITLMVYEDPIDLPSHDIRGTRFASTELSIERHLIDSVAVDLLYDAAEIA